MSKIWWTILTVFVVVYLGFMGWVIYDDHKINKRWDEVKKDELRFGWKWERGDPIENLPLFLREEATRICTITYFPKSDSSNAFFEIHFDSIPLPAGYEARIERSVDQKTRRPK